MIEKNIVGKYNIEDEYPVFGYDSEDGGGTPAVSPIAKMAKIEGVSSIATADDPVDQWRDFSEQLRNRRLAREGLNPQPRHLNSRPDYMPEDYPEDAQDKGFDPQQDRQDARQVNHQAAQRITAPDQQFQKDYEQDMVEFTHSPDPMMLGLQRYLAAVNDPIADEQLRDYETPEKHDEPEHERPARTRQKLRQNAPQPDQQASSDPVNPDNDDADAEHEHEQEPGALQVADVMTKRVVCVLESTTIEQVASICNRRGFSGVPVVNEQKGLIGIVTLRDILHQLIDKRSLSTYAEMGGEVLEQKALAILEDPVRLYMHREVITVTPETSVREACQLMLKHGIRRLVVARGDLVRGVFSAQDAVRVLAAADLRVDG